MHITTKERVVKDIFIEYDVGDVVRCLDTSNIGIIIDVVEGEEQYKILFFDNGKIAQYPSNFLSILYHITIPDSSYIKKCYLNKNNKVRYESIEKVEDLD